MNPELYAEMNLVFSQEFDVSIISELTGIKNAEVSTSSKPIAGKPVDVYWSIKTTIHHTYDLSDVLTELVQLVTPHIPLFKQLCEKFKGEVNFCVVASFHTQHTPALYFEREFLNIANMMDATIEIDMYPE